MNKYNSNIIFWSHVDKSAGLDNCWPWIAFRDKSGYGTTYWRGRRGLKAHRVAYEISYGPIKKGLFILHSCDNPACCNPKHLRMGTVQDNSNDMKARGRQALGIKNGNAKLTNTDVLQIRRLISSGTTQETIAKSFGVSQHTISKISLKDIWTHI